MKKIPLTLAALAALIISPSCSKEQGPDRTAEPLQEGESYITVSAGPVAETKALSIADDTTDTKKVNSLQVFAFDSDGALQSYESIISGSSITMKLNIGQEYTFWAVANNYAGADWKYPAVAAIKSQDEFKNIMTDLKSNSRNDLLMFSQSGVKKTIIPGTNELGIDVSRLVSKVQIRKITADFGTNTALKSKSLMIDSIYVINAVKNESLCLAPASTPSYYNNRKYLSGGADLLLADRLGTSFELSTAAGIANPYTTEHTFFTYGNATDLPTRLVVSCRWGDHRTYYPLDITGADGKLNPNCAYIIRELTIKGLGSDDPNVIPERKDFSATVSIKDWGTGFEKSVTM